MICPGNNVECDNPGCRRGGCQGRKPVLPLFRVLEMTDMEALTHKARLASLVAAEPATPPASR
jgi:hypothetical protein